MCCSAGTVCNYFLDSGLNRATLLFPGVACFACAVVAGSLTHVFNEEHLRKRKHAFDACAPAWNPKPAPLSSSVEPVRQQGCKETGALRPALSGGCRSVGHHKVGTALIGFEHGSMNAGEQGPSRTFPHKGKANAPLPRHIARCSGGIVRCAVCRERGRVWCSAHAQ